MLHVLLEIFLLKLMNMISKISSMTVVWLQRLRSLEEEKVLFNSQKKLEEIKLLN